MSLSTSKVISVRKKRWAPVAFAIGMSFTMGVASACSSMSGSTNESETLRVGVTASEVSTLDPYANTVSQDAYMRLANIYDTLVYRTSEGMQWGLAVGLTHNDSNTVWTVKLRKNVTFHDGSSFGADDVVATVRYILNPDNNVTFASKLKRVESVEQVDELTVKFKLSEPSGVFKQVLAYQKFVIPKKGFPHKTPIGTGAFKLASFSPARRTVLQAYDGYWGGRPKVDKVEIISFQTPEAVTNALLGGQIDVTSVLTRTTINTIQSRPNLELLKSEPIRVIRIGMRSDTPPFDDVRVRKAMRLLLDRDLALSNAFNGMGKIANDWPMGIHPKCNPDLPQRKQNVAKAKQLLKEAGVYNKTFTLRTGANQPGMLREVQILAQNAKEAGINIKIRKMSLGSFLDKWGDWTFFTGYTTPTYRRQAQSLTTAEPSINPTRWQDPEFEKLYNELIQTADAQRRCEIKKTMKKIQYERGGAIYAVANPVLTAHRKGVTGLQPHPLDGIPYNFSTVSIS